MIELLPIQAKTYAEIWEALKYNVTSDSSFSTKIVHNNIPIQLNMEIDPGTGLSKSWEFTLLKTAIPDSEEFEFTIRDADLLDQVKMLFLKKRIKTGFDELDRRLVVKSNNENIVRQLFDHHDIRQFFIVSKGFQFGIYVHYTNHNRSEQKQKVLELKINTAINDPEMFKTFYHVFYTVFGIIVPN